MAHAGLPYFEPELPGPLLKKTTRSGSTATRGGLKNAPGVLRNPGKDEALYGCLASFSSGWPGLVSTTAVAGPPPFRSKATE